MSDSAPLSDSSHHGVGTQTAARFALRTGLFTRKVYVCSGRTYVRTYDANGHAKGPVSQFSFPLVLRLTMSPSGDIIRVAAVTVVKVEAVKEPVPSQLLSCWETGPFSYPIASDVQT